MRGHGGADDGGAARAGAPVPAVKRSCRCNGKTSLSWRCKSLVARFPESYLVRRGQGKGQQTALLPLLQVAFFACGSQAAGDSATRFRLAFAGSEPLRA